MTGYSRVVIRPILLADGSVTEWSFHAWMECIGIVVSGSGAPT